MSIIKIKDVYLYTALTSNANDSLAAIEWLDQNNINYTMLSYGADEETQNNVLSALSTWWFCDPVTNVVDRHTFTQFPFVVYDAIDDQYEKTKRYLEGISAITSSNLVELSAL